MTTETINVDAMNNALDAIHEEALRILIQVSSDARDLNEGLKLIISLARFKHDIRATDEIKKIRGG